MKSVNVVRTAEHGFIVGDRIVAAGRADAAAMRRLVNAAATDQVIILTGGDRRQTVVVLDSGHLVVTALSLNQLERALTSPELWR